MKHFLQLARRGKPGTGASGGELAARRLAIAIIENAPGLDEEAIEDATDFMRLASSHPNAARAQIDEVT